MKTVVTVIIYNRTKNLIRWLDVWNRIKPKNAELRIIHNIHPTDKQDNFKGLVESSGATYIPRVNIGFDIGSFQDVCKKRLKGFVYDFDFLLWLTDDTFPMRATFVDEFIFHLSNQKVGLTCFEISPMNKKHVRTTGFCLRSEIIPKIIFDIDPVRTKEDCWQFEHRSQKSLYNQILALKYEVVQISPVPSSPVWDSGGGGIKWPDREEEFLNYWKIEMPPSKVIVIAPAFSTYPQIVPSMICQTYKNWELHLVHDGPATQDFPRFKDDRIIFTEMPHRRKEYGHPIRIDYLNKIKAKEIDGKYVLITNHDNYHVPHYLEKLLKPLEENRNFIGSYCSMMVHNYVGDGTEILPEGQKKGDEHCLDGYGILKAETKLGGIDCASAVIRADLASSAGWPSTRPYSDWDYLNTIAIRNGGWTKFAKVFGALLVHN